MATFQDLLGGISLANVETFSGEYPAGSYVGRIVKSRIEDSKLTSGAKNWVVEIKPDDGQATSRSYIRWMEIPMGSPETWSDAPEPKRDGTPGASRKQKNETMMKVIATFIQQLLGNADPSARDSFSPEQAEGLYVSWKIYHSKTGQARLDSVKTVPEPQQQYQQPQGFAQPQVTPVPQQNFAQPPVSQQMPQVASAPPVQPQGTVPVNNPFKQN